MHGVVRLACLYQSCEKTAAGIVQMRLYVVIVMCPIVDLIVAEQSHRWRAQRKLYGGRLAFSFLSELEEGDVCNTQLSFFSSVGCPFHSRQSFCIFPSVKQLCRRGLYSWIAQQRSQNSCCSLCEDFERSLYIIQTFFRTNTRWSYGHADFSLSEQCDCCWKHVDTKLAARATHLPLLEPFQVFKHGNLGARDDPSLYSNRILLFTIIEKIQSFWLFEIGRASCRERVLNLV